MRDFREFDFSETILFQSQPTRHLDGANMSIAQEILDIKNRYIVENNHVHSHYFQAIKDLVKGRTSAGAAEKENWQAAIDDVYQLVADEIRNNFV